MKFKRKNAIFKPLNTNKSGLIIKRRSPQDTYSADKQMKQIKKDLQTHGIRETEDDDDDE